jgi:hypothetical protein
MSEFVFRGTTVLGSPTAIKAIAWRLSGSGTFSMRVYDLTNALEICEVTGLSSAVATIQDFGSLSNLPTGEAMWEVQAKVSSGGNRMAISGLEIQW